MFSHLNIDYETGYPDCAYDQLTFFQCTVGPLPDKPLSCLQLTQCDFTEPEELGSPRQVRDLTVVEPKNQIALARWLEHV